MRKLNIFFTFLLCLTSLFIPTVSSLADDSIANYVLNQEVTKSTNEEAPVEKQPSEDELKMIFQPILEEIITNRNACIKALDDESSQSSQYQAGIRCPHHSCLEMHQSRIFSSQVR